MSVIARNILFAVHGFESAPAFRKTALAYGRSKGLAHDAEDFAQYATLRLITKGNAHLPWLICEYKAMAGKKPDRSATTSFYDETNVIDEWLTAKLEAHREATELRKTVKRLNAELKAWRRSTETVIEMQSKRIRELEGKK